MVAWPLDNLFLACIYPAGALGKCMATALHQPHCWLSVATAPQTSPFAPCRPFPSHRDGVWCLHPFSQRFSPFQKVINSFCPTCRQLVQQDSVYTLQGQSSCHLTIVAGIINLLIFPSPKGRMGVSGVHPELRRDGCSFQQGWMRIALVLDYGSSTWAS